MFHTAKHEVATGEYRSPGACTSFYYEDERYPGCAQGFNAERRSTSRLPHAVVEAGLKRDGIYSKSYSRRRVQHTVICSALALLVSRCGSDALTISISIFSCVQALQASFTTLTHSTPWFYLRIRASGSKLANRFGYGSNQSTALVPKLYGTMLLTGLISDRGTCSNS
ncbi:hypothetical protein QAD02_017797 [Eretmocerus hayati]|uniref:Uncharacterized protein n=1 Tax=Eretmocerus hayati TaxID=131215 RepID=A0ACC2PJQ1_9HYME|nr:hypothetical protein QAD02_017797 [Eretmocerus hayati]